MNLLAVVVLYQMQPSGSPTLRTLQQAMAFLPGKGTNVATLIWDNSPTITAPSDLPSNTLYVSAPDNPGLSTAYNRAMEIAREKGCQWLLTLDQDTELPATFLSDMARIADSVEENPKIAAIVPRIVGSNKLLSPFTFKFGSLPYVLPRSFTGVSPDRTYAMNSAAILRVASLERIGGYNPDFPLDISDLDLFHRLSLAGMSVYVAGSVRVAHDFSLLDKCNRMSTERYRSMLRCECAFWDMSMGGAARAERMLRLALRVGRDLFKPGTAAFQRIASSEILRRLCTARDKRMIEWRILTATRRYFAPD